MESVNSTLTFEDVERLLGPMKDFQVMMSPEMTEFVQRIGSGGDFTTDELLFMEQQAEEMVQCLQEGQEVA